MLTQYEHSRTHATFLNDMEGFLLDTELPKRTAFVHVVEELFARRTEIGDFGWTLGLRRAEVVTGLNERFADLRFAEPFRRDPALSVGEQILQHRNQITSTRFAERIELMPGASALLRSYGDTNATAGIVTSTETAVTLQMLRAAQIPDEFDIIIAGDTPGLTRGKPYPDPFLLGAFRLSVKPEQCWVLGDALPDILGAKAAGMRSIYAPDRRIMNPVPEAVKHATHTVANLFEAAEIVLDLMN